MTKANELPIIERLTRTEGYMVRPVNPDGPDAAAIITEIQDKLIVARDCIQSFRGDYHDQDGAYMDTVLADIDSAIKGWVQP